jgi:hypothetical protein
MPDYKEQKKWLKENQGLLTVTFSQSPEGNGYSRTGVIK